MRGTIQSTSVALAAMLAFVNCEGAGFSPPDNVKETFEKMYPEAKWSKWEISNSYYVAEFHHLDTKTEAWFSSDGEWSMTESDLEFRQLPVVVRNDFDAGEFAAWEIDDIDKLERQGMEDLYIIEVERGDQEMDLHYLPNGTRIKTVVHDGPNTPPADLPENVKACLREKHPSANIIEIEEDKGLLEISVVENHVRKKLIFDHRHDWIVTHWEIHRGDVPPAIATALGESAYSRHQIEDIEYEERADGSRVYIFEMELGHQEVTLHVDAATAQILSAIQDE